MQEAFMTQIQALSSLYPPFVHAEQALALLMLRLVWGVALVAHGYGKIKHPFHWMQAEGTIVLPTLLQAVGASTIFGGGIAITVGFLTPFAAFGLTATMILALGLHLLAREPFIKEKPNLPGDSYEASIVYVAIALLFIAFGPGIYSLDYLLYLANQ